MNSPWNREPLNIYLGEQQRDRDGRRLVFKIVCVLLLAVTAFEGGLQVGIRSGRKLERQTPEYKQAKAKWIEEVTDKVGEHFRIEQVKILQGGG